jgi:hypothetical protein
MMVSERQSNEMRNRYFKSMLLQDQEWYDGQADPATLGTRCSSFSVVACFFVCRCIEIIRMLAQQQQQV